jgi:hypothetical protein
MIQKTFLDIAHMMNQPRVNCGCFLALPAFGASPEPLPRVFGQTPRSYAGAETIRGGRDVCGGGGLCACLTIINY